VGLSSSLINFHLIGIAVPSLLFISKRVTTIAKVVRTGFEPVSDVWILLAHSLRIPFRHLTNFVSTSYLRLQHLSREFIVVNWRPQLGCCDLRPDLQRFLTFKGNLVPQFPTLYSFP